MILNNELDYAIVLTHSKSPQIVSRNVLADHIYLCVTDELLRKYYSEDEVERLIRFSSLGTKLSPFLRLPFCIPDNRMGNAIKQCFIEENVIPNKRFNTTYIQPCSWIAFQSIAASFVCDIALTGLERPKNVHLFPILKGNRPLTQDVFLIHNVNLYPSRYAKRFGDIALECFSELKRPL